MAEKAPTMDLAEQLTGRKPPRSFILDASAAEYRQQHEIIREDVKQNFMRFEFPAGFNRLDLLEECRALKDIDDFDLMYDITMQMIENKDVIIWVKNDKGNYNKAAEFHVTDKDMNMRGVEFIDRYPSVMLWMTEFIGAHLLKKYPRPGSVQKAPSKASEKTGQPKGVLQPATAPKS